MKTLREIEQEITHYGNARYTEAEWFEDVDKCAKHTSRWRDIGNKILYPLLDSLAAWDAVVREALPALKQEYEGLKALRDAKDDYQARYNAFALISAESYQKYVDMPTFETGRINTTGLARLEYLRGILEEEAP